MHGRIAHRRASLFTVAALALCGTLPAGASAHETGIDHTDTGTELRDTSIATELAAAQRAGVTENPFTVARDTLPTTTWCGDPTTVDNTADATYPASAPQFKVIYAHAADRPNRAAQWAPVLQANASIIEQYVAAQPGSARAPRFDLGTVCGQQFLDIQTVSLPAGRASYQLNFGAVRNAVAAKLNTSPGGLRNYVIFADSLGPAGNGLRGQGELVAGSGGDVPGASNPNNAGNRFSIMWMPDNLAVPSDPASGWWPSGVLHEMGHNIGAVQWSAPAHDPQGRHLRLHVQPLLGRRRRHVLPGRAVPGARLRPERLRGSGRRHLGDLGLQPRRLLPPVAAGRQLPRHALEHVQQPVHGRLRRSRDVHRQHAGAHQLRAPGGHGERDGRPDADGDAGHLGQRRERDDSLAALRRELLRYRGRDGPHLRRRRRRRGPGPARRRDGHEPRGRNDRRHQPQDRGRAQGADEHGAAHGERRDGERPGDHHDSRHLDAGVHLHVPLAALRLRRAVVPGHRRRDGQPAAVDRRRRRRAPDRHRDGDRDERHQRRHERGDGGRPGALRRDDRAERVRRHGRRRDAHGDAGGVRAHDLRRALPVAALHADRVLGDQRRHRADLQARRGGLEPQDGRPRVAVAGPGADAGERSDRACHLSAAGLDRPAGRDRHRRGGLHPEDDDGDVEPHGCQRGDPVAPLPGRRHLLHRDQRRESGELRADGRRRQRRAARARARRGRVRQLGRRRRFGRRRDCRGGAAAGDDGADPVGHGAARDDADRDPRCVDRQPDGVRPAVAPLRRRAGLGLREHRRRDGGDVHAGGRRRGRLREPEGDRHRAGRTHHRLHPARGAGRRRPAGARHRCRAHAAHGRPAGRDDEGDQGHVDGSGGHHVRVPVAALHGRAGGHLRGHRRRDRRVLRHDRRRHGQEHPRPRGGHEPGRDGRVPDRAQQRRPVARAQAHGRARHQRDGEGRPDADGDAGHLGGRRLVGRRRLVALLVAVRCDHRRDRADVRADVGRRRDVSEGARDRDRPRRLDEHLHGHRRAGDLRDLRQHHAQRGLGADGPAHGIGGGARLGHGHPGKRHDLRRGDRVRVLAPDGRARAPAAGGARRRVRPAVRRAGARLHEAAGHAPDVLAAAAEGRPARRRDGTAGWAARAHGEEEVLKFSRQRPMTTGVGDKESPRDRQPTSSRR